MKTMAGCILRKNLSVVGKGVFYLQLRKIIQTPDFPSKRNPHLRTKPLEQRRQELENYVQVAHQGGFPTTRGLARTLAAGKEK